MDRGKNQQSLKQAIESLLETYKLKGKQREISLIGSWEEVMGSYVNQHTRELFIKNRVLVVKLDSSTLRQELSYGKEKIKGMMNEKVGVEVVDRVVFK